MKKGIVLLLVVLALIVFVSPGLVGHLAEKSVDSQLEWAANENREVVITAEKFDRGWFSSEGRHRIAIGDSVAGMRLKEQLGLSAGAATPALLIDTRVDHGLIPVSSLTREEGSLLPGLGRAVSTLSIESIDGEITELPGVIYSSVGLDGGLTSRYLLEAGTFEGARWGAGDIEVGVDAITRRMSMKGGFDFFSLAMPGDRTYGIGKLDVNSDLTISDYGISVGDMVFTIESIDITSPEGDTHLGPFIMDAHTELDGDRINAATTMDFSMADVPPLGDIAWSMDVTATGLDARALARLQNALEFTQRHPQPDQSPTAIIDRVESDLLDIAARGFGLRFDKLDISLPQGTLFTKLDVNLPESNRPSFSWPGALLAMEAYADIRVPAALYEFATAMNPQFNAAVAMGYLKRNGDNYELAAQYKKGRLTVNGAPMTIPIPGN